MVRTVGDVENDGKNSNSNKWNQQRRLEFIDFRLGIDGKINRKDLVQFFSISVPQASLDLSKYHSMVEESDPPRKNLVYDRHLKVYLKTPDFQPLFPDVVSSESYFNDLFLASTGELSDSRNFFGFVPTVGIASFNPPRRTIKAEVLYNILEAIRTRKAVHVTYMSLNSKDNQDRLIAPHGLAYDGMRWHVRAYCYDIHEFRDYVLSRIVMCAVPKIPAPSDRYSDPLVNGFKEVGTTCRDDKDWNEFVDLILTANPELPECSRRAIEFDYGMKTDGTITYSCRKALLFYALYYLRLTKADQELPPSERQLVLVNKEDIYRRLDATH